MIDSISNTSPPPSAGQTRQLSLTDEQKALIESTLSGFDSDNLTQDQAIEIVETFASAGINPGKELADTLAEAGFDAREIGDLAREGNSSESSLAVNEPVDLFDLVDYLDLLLEQFGGNALSDEDKAVVYDDLRERFGLIDSESIISVTA